MNLNFIKSSDNIEKYLFEFKNKKYAINLTVKESNGMNKFTEKIYDENGNNLILTKEEETEILNAFYPSLLEFSC